VKDWFSAVFSALLALRLAGGDRAGRPAGVVAGVGDGVAIAAGVGFRHHRAQRPPIGRVGEVGADAVIVGDLVGCPLPRKEEIA
jgi:hypothetical protein